MFNADDIEIDLVELNEDTDELTIILKKPIKFKLDKETFDDEDEIEEVLGDIKKEIFETIDEYLEEVIDDLDGYTDEEIKEGR